MRGEPEKNGNDVVGFMSIFSAKDKMSKRVNY